MWRELQLAASASAGDRAANFGRFFNGAVVFISFFISAQPQSSLGS
jgi:hypothetical protein